MSHVAVLLLAVETATKMVNRVAPTLNQNDVYWNLQDDIGEFRGEDVGWDVAYTFYDQYDRVLDELYDPLYFTTEIWTSEIRVNDDGSR